MSLILTNSWVEPHFTNCNEHNNRGNDFSVSLENY